MSEPTCLPSLSLNPQQRAFHGRVYLQRHCCGLQSELRLDDPALPHADFSIRIKRTPTSRERQRTYNRRFWIPICIREGATEEFYLANLGSIHKHLGLLPTEVTEARLQRRWRHIAHLRSMENPPITGARLRRLAARLHQLDGTHRYTNRAMELETNSIAAVTGSQGALYLCHQGQRLDKGRNKDVFLGLNENQESVAVARCATLAQNEIHWLTRLQGNIGIVPLLDFSAITTEISSPFTILVTVPFNSGNLWHYSRTESTQSEEILTYNLATIAYHLFAGLMAVHRAGGVMKNIAIEHAIIDCHPFHWVEKAAWCNLSQASPLSNSRPQGSSRYRSPECLATNRHTQSDDLWALGIVIYFLIRKQFPEYLKDPEGRRLCSHLATSDNNPQRTRFWCRNQFPQVIPKKQGAKQLRDRLLAVSRLLMFPETASSTMDASPNIEIERIYGIARQYRYGQPLRKATSPISRDDFRH